MSKSILVLENDSHVAEHIRRSTLRLGYNCEIAANAEAAMTRLTAADKSVSLLVINYALAKNETGLDFHKRLRNSGWQGHVILITELVNETILLSALRSGVTDVFPRTDDFIQPLVQAVNRILTEDEQRAELEHLKSEQRLHERVEEAFRTAHISSWSWNPTNDKIMWAGTPFTNRGSWATRSSGSANHWEVSISLIKSALGPRGWRKILRMLATKRRGDVFECEVPVIDGETTRWWLVRGTRTGDDILTPSGVAIDVTARRTAEMHLQASMEAVRQLNERLMFSITETHHRVKNSLQVVSSLLSIEFRRGKGLDESGLARMIGHVRGLAALHDLLTDRSRDGRDLSAINASEFLESLALILRRLVPQLSSQIQASEVELTPRKASSLAVIATELVMNASRYGSGGVELHFLTTQDGYRVFINSSPLSDAEDGGTASPMEPKASIELVNTLLASDFKTQLVTSQEHRRYSAYFDIPRKVPQEKVLGAFH